MKEACELLGVHIKTLQRWDRGGRIKCVRTVGEKRRVPESEIKRILRIKDKEQRKIIGYARVSSNTQKDDLERQIDTIKSSHFAGKLYGMHSHKYKKLIKTVKEIAGENDANRNSINL